MKKSSLTISLFLVSIAFGFSQEFNLKAEIRPRLENRHGFRTLAEEDEETASFISQRSRLVLGYTNEEKKIKLGMSVQNMRTWGDIPTLGTSDVNGTALHEGWAELMVSDKLSLKMGRQEISYDDQRIFGSVDWVQQARSHDAFLAKFKLKNQQKLDIGLALNSSGEPLFDQPYNVNSYKALQYLWYNGTFGNVNLSIIALNNGVEFSKPDGERETQYSQTVGPRLKYGKDKFAAEASYYYQGGKSGDRDVSASYLGANVSYKAHANLTLTAGAEMISGKATNSQSDKIESFNPFYGTNHKFNGLMDYFYVGNHLNSVGLNDYYFTVGYKKDKFSCNLTPHFFSADENVVRGNGETLDKNLGSEVDFTLKYAINDVVTLSAGYSQMFATESLEYLKGGSKDETNNWSWLMVTFKPELFSFKKQ